MSKESASLQGAPPEALRALKGLGLRRINHTVDVVDTPGTRGLILKVRHLVTVDEGK